MLRMSRSASSSSAAEPVGSGTAAGAEAISSAKNRVVRYILPLSVRSIASVSFLPMTALAIPAVPVLSMAAASNEKAFSPPVGLT